MTVHELKWLARNAAELMTLSAQLQDGGIQLELLSGPLTGIYDPNGMGSMLFAVLAVAAQLDRNYIREKTLEGLVVAAANGNHGGRPKVFDDDMTTFALALRAKGVPVPEIAAKLTIKSGKNAGAHPSVASVTGPLPKPTTPRRCCCCPGPARPIWRTTARDSGHDPRSRAPAEGRPGAGGRARGVRALRPVPACTERCGRRSPGRRARRVVRIASGNHLRSL